MRKTGRLTASVTRPAGEGRLVRLTRTFARSTWQLHEALAGSGARGVGPTPKSLCRDLDYPSISRMPHGFSSPLSQLCQKLYS